MPYLSEPSTAVHPHTVPSSDNPSDITPITYSATRPCAMSTLNGMLAPRLWPLLLMMCGLAIVPTCRGTASAAMATTCIPLLGIASNATGSLDPKAFVDLDAVKVSLELEPFHPTSPVLRQIVECSAGLETPIAMRSVLGGSRKHHLINKCCQSSVSDQIYLDV